MRSLIAAFLCFVMMLGAVPASAKNIGGCPNGASDKWELVETASLIISPGINLASLDGNGDGLTCIKRFETGGYVFRDNTVGG